MLTLQLAYIWWRQQKIKWFLYNARHARAVQRELLLKKVRTHASSEFGRDHGFAEIRSIEDFRRRVPLTTYRYYLPYIERVKRGELQAMFAPGTKLHMFALTSGTTAEAKYIPITQPFLEEYREGWNMWGVRTYATHLDLAWKKTLGLSSNWKQFFTEGGIPCGNISGLVAETAPAVSRTMFLIPWTLSRINNPASKQYTALRLALAQDNVGMIMTANPSTLITLARLADARRESLIRDLYDGTVAADVELPADVRRLLRKQLNRPARARARELEKIVEKTGRLYPRDFWPKLTMLAIWLGGSAGAYLPRLKEYYGETLLRDHGLSASEGRMTMPLEDGQSAGILEYTHHAFEFIPEDEHDSPQPTVLEPHELAVGKNYYIVMTTSSGLYRYDIHDVVRCTGYQGEAPLLEFLNKGNSFCSITGEKLSEFQVVSAVKNAYAELGLPIDTFTLAPQFNDPPCYVLLVEEGTAGAHPEALARAIERHMGQWNLEYANRRETARLGPLQVHEIPPGTWAAFRQQRISRIGGSLEQYKHPCLASDLSFIPKLLELAPAAARVAIAS
ncbi:MAG: GH3 auxin-responsive promoter family protein [Thermoguttaceae bacterium]|jgi:hypothetical protein